jgi:hypothetical protein
MSPTDSANLQYIRDFIETTFTVSDFMYGFGLGISICLGWWIFSLMRSGFQDRDE